MLPQNIRDRLLGEEAPLSISAINEALVRIPELTVLPHEHISESDRTYVCAIRDIYGSEWSIVYRSLSAGLYVYETVLPRVT